MLQAVDVLDRPVARHNTPAPRKRARDIEREHYEDAVLVAAIRRVDAEAVAMFKRLRELDAICAASAGRSPSECVNHIDAVEQRLDLIVRLRLHLGNDALAPSVLRLDLDMEAPHDRLDWECAALQRQELLDLAGPFDVWKFLAGRQISTKTTPAAIAAAVGCEVPVSRSRFGARPTAGLKLSRAQ